MRDNSEKIPIRPDTDVGYCRWSEQKENNGLEFVYTGLAFYSGTKYNINAYAPISTDEMFLTGSGSDKE